MYQVILRHLRPWFVGWAAWGCASAMAASWQVCDLQVKVLEQVKGARTLYVQVLKAKPKGQAQCAPPGTMMGFRPETEDYQSELPRRLWPKEGQQVTVRHRYLDGQCKNIGACRIQHYSPVLR